MSERRDCEKCGKNLSRSGYYKHIKICEADEPSTDSTGVSAVRSPAPPHEGDSTPPAPTPSTDDADSEPPVEPDRAWLDYAPPVEEGVTESLPPPLKFIEQLAPLKGKKRLTAKDKKIINDTNIAVLKAGLGATDFLITKYGQAVMIDEEYECKHSDYDKSLVASAQNAYMVEKGFNISQHIGTGKIALIMTGYYVAPPLMKIQNNKRRKLLKSGFIQRVIKAPFKLLSKFRWGKSKTKKSEWVEANE